MQGVVEPAAIGSHWAGTGGETRIYFGRAELFRCNSSPDQSK
jgi:hypothetical protein